MKPKILLSGKNNMEFYVKELGASGAICEAFYLPNADAADYDGLLLCGGPDVAPEFYGEKIDGSVDIDDARDKCEFELVDRFVKAGKPVLGICRGCQLLNIYFGGNLIQHIDTADLHISEGDAVHKVVASCNGMASELYGNEFFVNSAHHQAICRPGKGLFVTLRSEMDDVVEAIEHKDIPIIGFQFHPERMCLEKCRSDTVDGIKIFQRFVSICKEAKDRG